MARLHSCGERCSQTLWLFTFKELFGDFERERCLSLVRRTGFAGRPARAVLGHVMLRRSGISIEVVKGRTHENDVRA